MVGCAGGDIEVSKGLDFVAEALESDDGSCRL